MTDLTKTEMAIIVALTPIACITYPFRWLAWACKSKYKKGSAPGLWAVLLAFVILAGCSTTGNPTPEPDPVIPVPILTGTVERAAVCIGVLSTGKYFSYGYESLYCPGADVDMWAVKRMANEAGITNVTTLLSQQATWAGVKAAILAATKGFGPEDLLVLSLSGHGGRVKDQNGDEASGYDSTLCLYDTTVLDDLFWAFVQKEVPPCRITIITDTCYAAGNWRWYQREQPITLVRATGTWAGSIVQLAACRDNESALGQTMGGQWTYALDTTHPAPTLQQWFDWSRKECSDQTPTLSTYGPLAAEMLAGEPFK